VSQEVLIVEDDRALARKLVRTVESAGYRARLAHDGEAAMREVAHSNPDLVLLDLLLPKKDGRSVLMLLQSAEATNGIPVIAMSGIFRGPSNARDLTQAGASGFLEKPFSAEDLVSQLHAHLGPPKEPVVSETTSARVSLSERSVAEVLWDAMQQGLTGAVHFRAGRHHKVVLLDRGEPRSIRSNAVRECLGQRLMKSGRIGEQALQESFRRAKSSDRKQGELLVAMGALTRGELDQALARQAEGKLLDLFAWLEGESWTQAGVTQDSLASPLEGWTQRATILRGVEMMPLDWAEQKLAPYRDCAITREKLELSHAETSDAVAALLKCLEPGSKVGELMQPHAPALFGLWLVGGVRFDEKGSKRTGATPVTAEQLRELLATQAKLNHFQVLGVSPNVAPLEIRPAFVRLAKLYHPDRFRGVPSELAALAAEVFARISTAHDTLTDPQARQVYESELKTGKSAEQQRKDVRRIVEAEQECRRGEGCLKARDHEQASAHFQRALEFEPNEGEFHALYGWTLFLTKSEQRPKAIEHLKKAIDLAPQSPTGYYYLGQLLKACEDPDGAGKMFRKVLSLRPEHVEASRELRLMQKRFREAHGSKSGKLFGFGRKK